MNPQDSQQPVAPQPQPAPEQQTQFDQTSAPVPPAPKRGLSKGALWGIIGGIIGLLLIVGTILAVVLLSGPSAEDYRKASAKMDELSSTYNEAGRDIMGGSSMSSATESEMEATANELKQAKEDINGLVDELGEMKAVAKDKEVKEKYDVLKKDMAGFNEAVVWAEEVFGQIAPAVVKMNAPGATSTPEKTLETFSDTRKALEGLNIENEVNKEYVDGLIVELRNIEDAIKDLLEANESGTSTSSARSKYLQSSSKVQTITREWQTNMREVSDKAEISDQINDLKRIIESKV